MRTAPGRRARGQALVEFALVLVIATTLLLTLFDLGRIVFIQNAIIQGAREGARAGAVEASFTMAKYAAIRSAVIADAPAANVVASDITGDAPTCPAPGDADDVSPTTCFYPDGPTGSTVVVNVSITLSTLSPVIPLLSLLAGWDDGGSVTLTARSVGQVQSTASRADRTAAAALRLEPNGQ
jgi:Flp pilus assembly protein TadG